MAAFIKGMIVGATITAAALGGYAYGTSQEQNAAPDSFEAADPENTSCRVSVGSGRLSVGDQCRFNQVMVGTRSGYLLCADLQVSCP